MKENERKLNLAPIDEFLEVNYDYEIHLAKESKNEGKRITWDYHIKLLKELKELGINSKFEGELNLKELIVDLKDKTKKLKREDIAGRKKGSKIKTAKKDSLKRFLEKCRSDADLNKRKYEDYENYCLQEGITDYYKESTFYTLKK